MAAGRTTLDIVVIVCANMFTGGALWTETRVFTNGSSTTKTSLSVLITSLEMDRFSGASSWAPLSPSLSLRFNSGTIGFIGGLGKKSSFLLVVAIAADVVIVIVCGNVFTGALWKTVGSRILGGLTDGGEVSTDAADLAIASGAGSERFLL